MGTPSSRDGHTAAQDRLTVEYDRERAAVLSTAVGIARQRLRDGDAEGARSTLDSAATRSTEMLREYLIAYGKTPAEVDAFLAVTGVRPGEQASGRGDPPFSKHGWVGGFRGIG